MRHLPAVLLTSLIFLGGRAFGATYYIDYSSGSDSDNGTSKSTPWKHAPGMVGCTGACASATPKPGDQFILKGGVTWPNGSLGWAWIWSGNASTHSPGCGGPGCIYIGVDQTWFSGASWSRPILNGGGAAVAVPPVGGPANVFLHLTGNYVIVDNLEFTGLFWTGTPGFGQAVYIELNVGGAGSMNDELMNNYIHGWSHTSNAGGATSEATCAVLGDTGIPNGNANTLAHSNVIDGSDTDMHSCSGFFGGPPYIVNNFVQWVVNGFVGNGAVLIDGNTFLHIPQSFQQLPSPAHTNGIEVNAARNVVVSNNLIGHLGIGTLGLWLAPYPGYTATAYNNVIFDTDTGNVVDVALPVYTSGNGCSSQSGVYCSTSGTYNFYNNTVECGQDANPNAVCVGIVGGATAVTLYNNHWITNATSPNGGMWMSNGPTPTLAGNLLQSKTVATGQGYTLLEPLIFSPLSGGTTNKYSNQNLTSLCSGSLAGLCNDTSYGVSYDSTNHVVTGPGRSVSVRPSSGNWDAGAYFLGGIPLTSLQPPGTVTAVSF